MKKNIRNLITFLVVIVLLSSCMKELKFDDKDFKPMFCLNGIVTQGDNFVVNVSQTHSILEQVDSVHLFILDATLKLYENDKYLETLIFDSLGIYHSINKAKEDTKYKITVEKEGFETATGYFNFGKAPIVEIKDVEYEISDTTRNYDKPEIGTVDLYVVKLNFTVIINDNVTQNDSYIFSAKTNVQEIRHVGIYNGTYEEYIEYINRGISELHPYFAEDVDMQKYNKSVIDYNYDEGFALNDNLFNGQKVEFKFDCYFSSSELKPVVIKIKKMPDELIKYNESERLSSYVSGNPYTEPVNIYSNVENGVGFTVGLTSSNFEVIVN